MSYFLLIGRKYNDDVLKEIDTWPQVVMYLRQSLPSDAMFVNIGKISSNSKSIAKLRVTMENIVKVATSLTDKVLYGK